MPLLKKVNQNLKVLINNQVFKTNLSSLETKNSKSNITAQSFKMEDSNERNNASNKLVLNEMPIYSQVQRPYLTNGNNNSNINNRNLIITNGTTNADSWV